MPYMPKHRVILRHLALPAPLVLPVQALPAPQGRQEQTEQPVLRDQLALQAQVQPDLPVTLVLRVLVLLAQPVQPVRQALLVWLAQPAPPVQVVALPAQPAPPVQVVALPAQPAPRVLMA